MPHRTDTALGDRTIVAVITPPGEGGIAAVRLAGPRAVEIATQHFRSSLETTDSGIFRPWMMRHGYFCRPTGELVDEITAVYMPPGRSYTGEEQVEIFCHGGYHVIRLIQGLLVESGAHVAQPGEFTRLAFLNGRIDLTRAEAVANIVAAGTERSYVAARQQLSGRYASRIHELRRGMLRIVAELEAAIDFPEEDTGHAEPEELGSQLGAIQGQVQGLAASYEAGRMVRDGFRIAIAGPPNAGKSSLLNQLLRRERALVTATPGTTRDYISEWIDLDGFAVELTDTAGVRETAEEVERAGQEASRSVIERAHLIIWMVDVASGSRVRDIEAAVEPRKNQDRLIVGNKIDLLQPGPPETDEVSSADKVLISCKTGQGLDQLRREITRRMQQRLPDQTEGLLVTSARHEQLLRSASASLERAKQLINAGESPELIAFEVKEAVKALDEITGRIYNEEVLEEIFSRFCIGK